MMFKCVCIRKRVIALVFAIGFCGTVHGEPAQNPSKTVLDGAYTVEQAARGEGEYVANCAYCHRDNLDGSGSPSLFGNRFMDNWREEPLSILFNYIRAEMPRGEGGALSAAVYTDILAYILRSNTLPAGGAELHADALETILLIDRGGPKPLPNLSQVLVVGCLVPDQNGGWTLTKATLPVRNRKPDETNPEELKKSMAAPPGTLTFRLTFDNLGTFDVESHRGGRMQAKGVLGRQTSGDRISLTSFETLSSACLP